MAPTLTELQQILRYAPDEGAFYWRIDNRQPKARAGMRAGRVNVLGRAQVGYKGKQLFVHRVVWLFETGAWPVGMVDHIDGNPLNNVFSNLRESDHSLNGQNQRAWRNGKLLGTSWHKGKGKYIASIKLRGKRIHLGYFENEELAHRAYVDAKRSIHPAGNL
jgi:hypothetical protein